MSVDAATFPCPECGQTMTIASDRSNLLVCPGCGAESFVPDPEPPPAESLDHEPPAGLRKDDLDAARIRRLSIERRSLNRTASYFVVAAGACGVTIAQLAWLTIQHVRRLGWTPRPIGYVLFIVLAGWGAWYFVGRATQLRREARTPLMAEPTAPPDFSMLDDGSKHWKNLEDVR